MSVDAEARPGNATAQSGRASRSRLISRPEFGAAAGTLFVWVFFAVAGRSAHFASWSATSQWMAVAAELGLLALPIGMHMIAGQFDLSIGSVLAASSMVVAILHSQYDWPLGLAAIAALAVGAAVGLVNGLLVVRTGLPSFIVTLVTLFSVSGLALWLARRLTGTTAVSMRTSGFFDALFGSEWKNFNVSALWWAGSAIVCWVVLQRSRFGNWMFAVGGDVNTALQEGVAVARVRIGLYIWSGFSAALVGVIQAIEFNNADVTRGQNFVFQTIVAAVVGGCLLSGGYGSAIGIVLGTMTYSIVSIGIFFTGWTPDLVQLFVGILLFLAVLGNNLVRRLALTRP